MRVEERKRTSRTSRVAILATSSLFVLTSFALAEPGETTIEAVLANPPAQGSPARTALYETAGQPQLEILAMTKGEVWRIPSERWDAFVAVAEKTGVHVTKLDTEANHVLAPMHESGGMSAAQQTMMHETMSSKAVVGMTMMTAPDPMLEEYALTQGMHAAGSTEPHPELVIPITDGKSIAARRISVAPVAGGYAWHGVVEETGEPVTLLWWPTGKMSGSVTYKGHVYAVHNIGGGMHAIVEMDPGRMPDEHAPMAPEMMHKMQLRQDPLVSKGDASMLMDKQAKPAPEHSPGMPEPDRSHTRNQEDAGPTKIAVIAPGPMDITHAPLPAVETMEPAVIRLIVAYTKAAAAHYSDIETDLIPLAIEEANESFRMSGITNVTLELAYTYETNYVESGTHFDHVFRFADKGDGYMDEVHELRDKYKADVGVLIVHDPHGCGLSAEVHARSERAFAVVHHECAANMYSLAHEIGHLIGARHDEALDDSKEPFAYGHGYVFSKSWRTMMAYKDSCDGCPRIPVWSNPAVLVKGVPAGDDLSDNARVIAEQAARVAKFR